MPANMIKSLAEKSGKSEKEVEKAWNEAKNAASESYSKDDEPDKYWGTVVAITKKKIGISDSVGPVYVCGGCSSLIADSDKFCECCGSTIKPKL